MTVSAIEVPVRIRRARATPLRVVLGTLLVTGAVLPAYRVLGARETGLAGEATVAIADTYYALFLDGLPLLALSALLGAILLGEEPRARLARRLSLLLLRPRTTTFAFALAAVGAALTFLFTQLVLGGLPNHIDSLSQLLHARFWSEGRLAGPHNELTPFWMIQNSIVTPHGWVSQYPPGHIALLALGIALGVPALTGAITVGVLLLATVLFAARLLPSHALGVRIGGVLMATSPFVICLGGSYMSHATAAALLAGAAYALLRSRDGHGAWAALAGFLFAGCVATRPLTGIAAGAAIIVGLVVTSEIQWRKAAFGALIAGAAPVLLALAAYNAYFFGSPLRFGYAVALGPQSGLGFQRDPWGNVYGPIEALGYTSADLVSLNVALFESPLPALLLVAAFLFTVKVLPRGVFVLLGWALLPLAANLLYWHHGQFMGPRMLYETAPAWLLLSGLAVVELPRRIPAHYRRAPRLALRSAAVTALLFCVGFGWLFLAPARALSYGSGADSVLRTPLPDVPPNALVFVHDAWRARLAMQLAAAGMRLDSVEVAVRANASCAVQKFVDAVSSNDVQRTARLVDELDFRARGRDLPKLTELTAGNRVILAEGKPLESECMRQLGSERAGVLDIAPLLWRGALIGSSDARPLFVRDLGPELNRRLLAAEPAREPFVYTAFGTRPALLDYRSGMVRLWGAP